MRRLMLVFVFLLAGCTGIPEGIEPVDDFELEPYLWILAREPQLPQAMLDELLAKAEAAGYDTSDFIYVEHDRAP